MNHGKNGRASASAPPYQNSTRKIEDTGFPRSTWDRWMREPHKPPKLPERLNASAVLFSKAGNFMQPFVAEGINWTLDTFQLRDREERDVIMRSFFTLNDREKYLTEDQRPPTKRRNGQNGHGAGSKRRRKGQEQARVEARSSMTGHEVSQARGSLKSHTEFHQTLENEKSDRGTASLVTTYDRKALEGNPQPIVSGAEHLQCEPRKLPTQPLVEKVEQRDPDFKMIRIDDGLFGSKIELFLRANFPNLYDKCGPGLLRKEMQEFPLKTHNPPPNVVTLLFELFCVYDKESLLAKVNSLPEWLSIGDLVQTVLAFFAFKSLSNCDIRQDDQVAMFQKELMKKFPKLDQDILETREETLRKEFKEKCWMKYRTTTASEWAKNALIILDSLTGNTIQRENLTETLGTIFEKLLNIHTCLVIQLGEFTYSWPAQGDETDRRAHREVDGDGDGRRVVLTKMFGVRMRVGEDSETRVRSVVWSRSELEDSLPMT